MASFNRISDKVIFQKINSFALILLLIFFVNYEWRAGSNQTNKQLKGKRTMDICGIPIGKSRHQENKFEGNQPGRDPTKYNGFLIFALNTLSKTKIRIIYTRTRDDKHPAGPGLSPSLPSSVNLRFPKQTSPAPSLRSSCNEHFLPLYWPSSRLLLVGLRVSSSY